MRVLKEAVGQRRLRTTPVGGKKRVCESVHVKSGVFFLSFAQKELIKVTFVGDTLGSGGNFGTCVCGAKLTVNTNNQSAGPIEHWRQSNEQPKEGGREGGRVRGREGGIGR